MKVFTSIALAACLFRIHDPITAQAITVPNQDAWQEIATGVEEGEAGDWDYYFNGAFANSLITLGDTYYHYYQGAAFYDYDSESNAYRQIGVATSNDLINWTKSPANPVITWLTEEGIDASNVEEGAVSTAPLILDGTLHMYYGANTHLSKDNITADGRLTTSTDGATFSDQGSVISGSDATLWGSGDEVFPLGAYTHEGVYYLFYVPNGNFSIVPEKHKLGVAWGTQPDQLTNSSAVTDSSGSLLEAWGPISPILLPTGEAYLFVVSDFDANWERDVHIYQMNQADPARLLTDKVMSYDFRENDCSAPTVVYDEVRGWIMMCRQRFINSDGVEKRRYSIRTVEDIQPSLTPPAPPPPLLGDIDNDGDVDWHDMHALLLDFGVSSTTPSDVNNDGAVDIFDFSVLVSQYGTVRSE